MVSGRYEAYLQKRIENNYELPSDYQYRSDKLNVVLRMEIRGDGELVNVEISESSGDSRLDTYCIEAVRKSAPFKVPPKELVVEMIIKLSAVVKRNYE